MTTSLPIVARVVSILCWITVAAVMTRVLAGGGTLAGVGNVFRTEPPVVLALIGATLIVAALAVTGIAQDRPWAWAASWKGSLVALASTVALLQAHHDSAALAAAAAGFALGIALAMTSRASTPSDP